MITRSYTELRSLNTFLERYEYLRLNGRVADPTFGIDRWMNQDFYRSTEWKHVRQHVIARDLGRDLGVDGYDIHDRIIIHHMNPMVPHDIIHSADYILDPEFLITTTHNTHNAIHYGDKSLLRMEPVERRSGDTKLW